MPMNEWASYVVLLKLFTFFVSSRPHLLIEDTRQGEPLVYEISTLQADYIIWDL